MNHDTKGDLAYLFDDQPPADPIAPHRHRLLVHTAHAVVGALALAVLLVGLFGWVGWILQPEPHPKPIPHTTTGDPR